jgi:phosphoserine phosphatase
MGVSGCVSHVQEDHVPGLSSRPAQEQGALLPLCVDLDGTLVLSDLLLESLILLLKRKPFALLLVPLWLARGRAALKAEVAARVDLSAPSLPYNHALIGWIRSERAAGRSVWLCTAANERIAASVADHLKLFDGVLASSSSVNLLGANKGKRLVERFGERGFDYCGNERRDIEIWKRARGAIVIGNDRFVQRVARHAVILRTFPCSRLVLLRALIRAIRPA